MSNAKLTLADLFGYSLQRSRRLRSRYHSHPKIHWGDPYNPWWWRLWPYHFPPLRLSQSSL